MRRHSGKLALQVTAWGDAEEVTLPAETFGEIHQDEWPSNPVRTVIEELLNETRSRAQNAFRHLSDRRPLEQFGQR